MTSYQCVSCGWLSHTIAESHCRGCRKRFGINSMRETDLDRVAMFAFNLITAAGLCRSFELALDGCDRMYYEQACAGIHDWNERWHPGCERGAP